MGQRPLFDTWFPSRIRIIEEHVSTLGRLPDRCWEKWENRDQCFQDQLQRIDGSPRRVLEDRVEDSIQKLRKECGMAEMDDEEKQSFLRLLRSMLSYCPEDRPSALQVLESFWMQKWAFQTLTRCKNGALHSSALSDKQCTL